MIMGNLGRGVGGADKRCCALGKHGTQQPELVSHHVRHLIGPCRFAADFTAALPASCLPFFGAQARELSPSPWVCPLPKHYYPPFLRAYAVISSCAQPHFLLTLGDRS